MGVPDVAPPLPSGPGGPPTPTFDGSARGHHILMDPSGSSQGWTPSGGHGKILRRGFRSPGPGPSASPSSSPSASPSPLREVGLSLVASDRISPNHRRPMKLSPDTSPTPSSPSLRGCGLTLVASHISPKHRPFAGFFRTEPAWTSAGGSQPGLACTAPAPLDAGSRRAAAEAAAAAASHQTPVQTPSQAQRPNSASSMPRTSRPSSAKSLTGADLSPPMRPRPFGRPERSNSSPNVVTTPPRPERASSRRAADDKGSPLSPPLARPLSRDASGTRPPSRDAGGRSPQLSFKRRAFTSSNLDNIDAPGFGGASFTSFSSSALTPQTHGGPVFPGLSKPPLVPSSLAQASSTSRSRSWQKPDSAQRFPRTAQSLEATAGEFGDAPEKPRDALRELLLERHGTLDDAFRWLDTKSRGKINMFQWDTGLRLLSLNNALIVRPSKVFAAMDSGHSGELTLKAWREYFGYEGDAPCEPGARGSDKDKLTGPRGARLLQNVRKMVATAAAGGPRRSKNCDDVEMNGPSLPKLQAVLELADEENCETMSPTRKAGVKQALVATDGERAEELQLAEDLQQMELQGIRALAYILAAKCGSLDAAFNWMDCMSRGYFVRVQWETAAIVMHLDIEKLTGMTTRSIFNKMAERRAKVSKKAWDSFFSRELGQSDWDMMNQIQRPFQKRASKKLKEVWKGKFTSPKRTSRANSKVRKVNSDPVKLPSQGGPGDGAGSSASTTVPEDPNLSHRSRDGFDSTGAHNRPGSQPTRSDDESRASSANSAGGSGAAGAGGAGRGGRPRNKLAPGGAGSGAAGGAGAGGENSHLGAGGSAVTGRRPPSANAARLSSAAAAASGAGGSGSSSARPRSKPDLEARAPSPQTEDEQRQLLRAELGVLGPDEGREYAPTRRSERSLIEEIAREFGLWCGQAGSQVLVYREGPVAAKIRAAISVLRPGQFGRVDGLVGTQPLFGQALAQNAGIWVAVVPSPSQGAAEDGAQAQALELFNNGGSLEDFAQGVRKTLLSLRPGEVVDFPSNLCEDQRNVIHAVAKEFDLVSKTLKDSPTTSHVAVGHLAHFRNRVAAELASIGPNEVRKYGCGYCESLGADMSRLERSVVQLVATDMGLQCWEREDRQGNAFVGVQTSAKPEVMENLGHTHDQDVIRQKVAKLFGLYSSGKQGETRFFLRKIDLTRFVQDAAQVSPRAHILQNALNAILREIELVFDETMELQLDLGCRKRYGLSQEYFQVFLSKASYILGWSMVSLLFALLELFES